MAKKKKHKNTDLPVVMDYGIGCISVYDPIAMMPYSDPPITEQTRFKKLGKEMKAEFKWGNKMPAAPKVLLWPFCSGLTCLFYGFD